MHHHDNYFVTSSPTGTCFHWLIPDNEVDPAKVEKLLFCSGKVYYELVKVKVTSLMYMSDLMLCIN